MVQRVMLVDSNGDPLVISGPNGAVDGNIVAFDGTTGAVTKDSGIAMADVPILSGESQAMTGGFKPTSKNLGTKATGTLTLDPSDCALQHYINGGAHTLAPSANTGICTLDITNNASAGAITTSGFTKVTGSFATTDALKYRCRIVVGNAGSSLEILAMQ